MQLTSVLVSLLMGAAVTAQKVHVVSVSDAAGSVLKYSPDNIKTEVGDLVQFQFRGGNHTVTQSSFDQPCKPVTPGVFSGFQPVAASAAKGLIPVFTIKINTTTPIWLYCSQGKHCQAGMNMVINENTAANASRSLDAYKALAKQATENLPGGAVSNGTASTVPSGSAGPTGGATPSGTGAGGPQRTTVAAASPLTIPTALSFLGVIAALLLA